MGLEYSLPTDGLIWHNERVANPPAVVEPYVLEFPALPPLEGEVPPTPVPEISGFEISFLPGSLPGETALVTTGLYPQKTGSGYDVGIQLFDATFDHLRYYNEMLRPDSSQELSQVEDIQFVVQYDTDGRLMVFAIAHGLTVPVGDWEQFWQDYSGYLTYSGGARILQPTPTPQPTPDNRPVTLGRQEISASKYDFLINYLSCIGLSAVATIIVRFLAFPRGRDMRRGHYSGSLVDQPLQRNVEDFNTYTTISLEIIRAVIKLFFPKF